MWLVMICGVSYVRYVSQDVNKDISIVTVTIF